MTAHLHLSDVPVLAVCRSVASLASGIARCHRTDLTRALVRFGSIMCSALATSLGWSRARMEVGATCGAYARLPMMCGCRVLAGRHFRACRCRCLLLRCLLPRGRARLRRGHRLVYLGICATPAAHRRWSRCRLSRTCGDRSCTRTRMITPRSRPTTRARLASAAQQLHWLSGIASLMRTKLLCVCQLRLRMSIDVVGGTQGGCATATHQSAV